MRERECLPAPVAVDVSVHTEDAVAGSIHDDTKPVDSVPASVAQPKALLGDKS